MNRKITVPIIVVGLIIFLAWFRVYTSPGAAAKRELRATISAFEEERILAVMSGVSRTYSDHLGLSFESIAGYVSEVGSTYEDLDVDLLVTEVTAEEEEVRIAVRFIIWGSVGGDRGYLVGSISDPCTATLLYRKERPGWRLASTLRLDIPELREELDELERRG
ncbi:MAG: hypothetical protein PVG92_08860 [Holophagae bacterium]|jgi:hypothetical protein